MIGWVTINLFFEFNISTDYRLQSRNESLGNSWQALTPSDAEAFKEDLFSTPSYLGVYYYPVRYLSFGPFVERNIYKIIDRKNNKWEPNGTHWVGVNVPSQDVLFQSMYKLKFNPVIYGIAARLNIPLKSSLITFQYKYGQSRLFDSKCKFTRLNEDQEIFDTYFFGLLMKSVKTTQVNLSGDGDFHGVTMGYFGNIERGEGHVMVGLEVNWQQSIIKELRFKIKEHDDSLPGFSVDQPGLGLPYPSFVEGDEGILTDEENSKNTSLDYGGFSIRLTLKIYILK